MASTSARADTARPSTAALATRSFLARRPTRSATSVPPNQAGSSSTSSVRGIATASQPSAAGSSSVDPPQLRRPWRDNPATAARSPSRARASNSTRRPSRSELAAISAARLSSVGTSEAGAACGAPSAGPVRLIAPDADHAARSDCVARTREHSVVEIHRPASIVWSPVGELPCGDDGPRRHDRRRHPGCPIRRGVRGRARPGRRAAVADRRAGLRAPVGPVVAGDCIRWWLSAFENRAGAGRSIPTIPATSSSPPTTRCSPNWSTRSSASHRRGRVGRAPASTPPPPSNKAWLPSRRSTRLCRPDPSSPPGAAPDRSSCLRRG